MTSLANYISFLAMTTTQTLHLDRGPGRIAYDVTGEGPLVVCIPGMGDLRSTFRHLVPALAGQGYRVATFDLRGHGDSDAGFPAYDDVAAAADAVALVEHLGAGPAVLVGSSMGAGAAVYAAAERPELVAGLALLGPFVRNPPMGRAKLTLIRAATAAMLVRPWGPAMWRLYYTSLFPTRKDAEFQQHRAEVLASLRRPGRWAAFRATARTSHDPVAARLGEVHVPAVAVMGTKDPDFSDPAAEARFIEQSLGARTVMVDGAGHYPQAEFPEVTSPAVVELAARAFARA